MDGSYLVYIIGTASGVSLLMLAGGVVRDIVREDGDLVSGSAFALFLGALGLSILMFLYAPS